MRRRNQAQKYKEERGQRFHSWSCIAARVLCVSRCRQLFGWFVTFKSISIRLCKNKNKNEIHSRGLLTENPSMDSRGASRQNKTSSESYRSDLFVLVVLVIIRLFFPPPRFPGLEECADPNTSNVPLLSLSVTRLCMDTVRIVQLFPVLISSPLSIDIWDNDHTVIVRQ